MPHEPPPTTAARRSGGIPPSHSHCSITQGQMRSVTAAASAREGSATCGKVSGRPQRMRTLWGRMRQPAADGLGADHGDRDDGSAGLEREPSDAALRPAEPAGSHPRALGEDHDAVAALQDRPRGAHHLFVRGAAVDREGAEGVEEPRLPAAREQLLLGHVVHGPAHQRPDHERVEERAMVGGEDHRPLLRHMLAADPAETEVEMEERLQDRAHEPVHVGVHAALPRAPVEP